MGTFPSRVRPRDGEREREREKERERIKDEAYRKRRTIE